MPNKIAISDLELSAISGWKPNQPFNQIPVASVLETKATQLISIDWKTNAVAKSTLEPSAINGWKPNQPFNQIPVASVLEQSAKTGWVQYISPGFKNPIFNTIPTNDETSLESSALNGWKPNQPFNTIPTNENSLESTSLQLDILSWKTQTPITDKTSLERVATPPFWVSGSKDPFNTIPTDDEYSLKYGALQPFWVSGFNDPFNTIPTDNEYSLKRDATPGWAKGDKKNVPGSPYGDPKLDEPAKYSNIRLLEFGIKTIVNSALAPFGTSANNYVKFNLGDSTYDTTPWWSIGSIPLAMLDFRGGAGKVIATLENKSATTFRLDGTSAALRNPWKSSALYAALSATTGPYLVFGRSAPGKKGKGWGDHDSTTAPRLDFTARSNVNTKWNTVTNSWIPTTSITDNITPFRGDKVTVIDFKQNSSLADAYRWKPTVSSKIKVLGKIMDAVNGAGKTSDFIKFYFTGPKILAGDNGEPDDIIAFRAIINRLTDTYNPQYTPVTMIGRADPNFHYAGYGREVGLDFTVYATDRDEMKPIYRKLNALAGYTAPTYSKNSIGLTAPWMRITVGDLLVQQPVLISSLTYGLTDSDTTWEINIEDDPEMMQAPHLITVSMGLTVVSDWLPENGGRFYSLAKQFDSDGIPIQGDDNWLSDFSGNTTAVDAKQKELTNYMKLLPTT